MLPKMSEEKTEDIPVTIISTQNEVSDPAVPPKPRSYRKYVIIAVTGIVVAAITLTAILVGMYFFTETEKEILKFSYNRDGNSKEDVTSDPNTNMVQFHVNNPDYEMWVVDDFNRDIQVMKILTDSGTNCYVAPLNRTTATDPSKVSVPSNPETMNASYTVTYQAANTPIPDTSFLSKMAKDTCKGISTYWVYPSCEAPNNPPDTVSRQKRRRRVCNECCCFYCYWILCLGVCLCSPV